MAPISNSIKSYFRTRRRSPRLEFKECSKEVGQNDVLDIITIASTPSSSLGYFKDLPQEMLWRIFSYMSGLYYFSTVMEFYLTLPFL